MLLDLLRHPAFPWLFQAVIDLRNKQSVQLMGSLEVNDMLRAQGGVRSLNQVIGLIEKINRSNRGLM